MKTLPAFHLIFLLFISLVGCKKSVTGEDSGPAPDPIKTAKGIANGTPVNRQIGSSGGELMSADGKLKLIVPAGAVSTATNFTVQPITNTLFEKEGRTAYRLLPEGTQFEKPVTLQFTYAPEDTLHTTEDALTVAYQREDGAWRILPTALNKTTKKLSVETSHFSDWTITGGLYIEADEKLLGLGQKAKLRVISVTRPKANSGNTDEDDVLAPLVPYISPEDRGKLESIDNWRIASGIGGLGIESGQLGKLQTEAEYSAPSSMTPTRKDITITVDVRGYNLIKDPAAPGGVRRLTKMILFEHLVLAKEFLKGTFGGQPFEFVGPEVGCELNPLGAMVFLGIDNNLFAVALSAKGSAPGSYSFDAMTTTASVTFWNGEPGYGGSWSECSQAGIFHFSPQPIEVTKWGAVGEYAEGSYTGPVYLQDGLCGKREKLLTVEFSIVRDR